MDSKKKSVYVAILHMNTVLAGLESSVYKWMEEKTSKYRFKFHLRSEVPTDSNRNHIVKDFLESDCDYLAMFDDDTYPFKNPFDLLDHDKEVIGCVYPGMGENGLRFHVYKLSDDGTYIQCPLEERTGLKEVDAVGAGAIMIKRSVLEKIKTPFSYIYDKDGVVKMSDDIAFCHRCHKKGIKMWTEWSYICSHFKTIDLLKVLEFMDRDRKTYVKSTKSTEQPESSQ